MTQSGHILTSKNGNVAVLELNRPRKRNALSQGLIDELIETLYQLDQDVAVRAVVLTGSEQGPFCGKSIRVACNVVALIACSWRGPCRTGPRLYSRGLSTWMAEGLERCGGWLPQAYPRSSTGLCCMLTHRRSYTELTTGSLEADSSWRCW